MIFVGWFAAVLSACAAMSVRSTWVTRVRIAILNANYDAYRTLPTYEVMMRRSWIWDASRFLDWPHSHADVEQEARDRAKAEGRVILLRRQRRQEQRK